MFEFFLFLLTVSITPGPNTIMSMANAAEKGLKGITLNIGMFLGISMVSAFSYIFVSALSTAIPSLSLILQLLSVAYLTYLAIKMLGKKAAGEGKGGSMREGFLMQIVNVKVMMLAVTAISTYILPSAHTALVKWMMVFSIPATCFITGLIWALAGGLIKSFYSAHLRAMNIVFSLSLFLLAAGALQKAFVSLH